jgi:Ca-activated chloride channel family protein
MPKGVQFADPWALALLALLPVIALYYWRLRPGRLRGGVVLATLAPLASGRRGWRVRGRGLLPVLRLLALVLLVVALARPQRAHADATSETRGIDIVLALDISGSMQEPGLGAKTKMEAAKAALKDFITGRANDRIGFVVFKSEERVMAPLTLDYRALLPMIDMVEEQNTQLSDGTAIGLGVAAAVNLLRNSPNRSRIIILATDGQNNSGRVSPDEAAVIAETLKMRLYTIGMVTAGANPEGTLDERDMQRWSERTGGAYARATDQRRLRQIYEDIATLEKSRIERQRLTQFTELAPYVLVPGLLVLLLEVALGTTLFRSAP